MVSATSGEDEAVAVSDSQQLNVDWVIVASDYRADLPAFCIWRPFLIE